GEALTHLPFSAHPTIDADGQWWNIGSWIYGGQALVFIYQLDQAGALKRFKRLALQQAGYMHAFCVSQNYLVLVNTAHLYQHKNEGNFFDKFQFDQQGHSQIVLIDKNTLSIERTIEIPANFVFHFGNAYELGNELFFTMAEYRDAQIMSRGLSIKETSVFGPNPVSYPSELCQYRIELNSGRWHKSGSGLAMEFPNFRQTQPFSPQALVGCGQRLNHGGQQRLEQLLQINPHTGTSDAYTFAENVSLDEPLYIQDSRGEEFIIHSFLDRQQNESGLALFKGADIGAGPIAKAWAGGVLPQGFHGCWVSA
ncbi:MAG: carotenoid oxygenase family protein, partial [Cellvibrionaceae bacterium]|nr:carotenoid oxygenase family protein [Cellvibrionaceae bacterium]